MFDDKNFDVKSLVENALYKLQRSRVIPTTLTDGGLRVLFQADGGAMGFRSIRRIFRQGDERGVGGRYFIGGHI